VVLEAKRFDVATKAEDYDVPEHLWDHRSLKVDQVPTVKERKALLLMCVVLLRSWRNITTRSLLKFLDLRPSQHIEVKRAESHYSWLPSGRESYSAWWHGYPRAGNQDVEIGRDCVKRISD
jgi:hypothetical protein